MKTLIRVNGNYNPNLPDVIYHYCSLSVMQSILSSENIRLSDSDKTSDSKENVILIERFIKVFGDIIDAKFKHSHKVKKIKTMFLQQAHYYLNKVVPYTNQAKRLIACFTEDGDLLSQWRGYGNMGQGVAIGFNAKYFNEFSDLSQYEFIKVIYNNAEADELVKNIINTSVIHWFDGLINEKNRLNYSDIMLDIGVYLSQLYQAGFMFKDSAFYEEREWRLFREISYSNYSFSDGYDDYGYSDMLQGVFARNKYSDHFDIGELGYVSSENDFKCYLPIFFSNIKKDIIKEIIIGPKCKATPLDIKLFLAQNGYIDEFYYDDIIVKKSEIPFI